MPAQTLDTHDMTMDTFTDADAPTEAPDAGDFPFLPVLDQAAAQAQQDALPAPDCFVPDTAEKVDWVLSKVADARARAARIRENAEKMAKEAEADADGLLFRYGPALQAFARQELTGKKKSLRLFHGVIGYRTRPAAVTVTDERAALEWARQNLPDAVTEKVDRALLASTLLQTGEVAPGTALVPAQEVFYTK